MRGVATCVLCVAAWGTFAVDDAPLDVKLPSGEKYASRTLAEWLSTLKSSAGHGYSRELITALQAVCEYGSTAQAATAELTGLLERSGNPELPRLALRALGAIGPDARAAEPALLAMLNNLLEDPMRRAGACRALIQINPGGAMVRKAVLAASTDRNSNVRRASLEALLILATPQPVVTKPHTTDYSATLLSEESALPLQSLLKAPRLTANLPAEPPGEFPFAPAFDTIVRALNTPAAARDAAEMLAALGERGVAPLLSALEKNPAPQVRQACAERLGEQARFAAQIFPALLQAAKKEQVPGVRSALAIAAVKLNPRDAEALGLLWDFPGSPLANLPSIHGKSVETILIEGGAAAWPALKRALNSDQPQRRIASLRILREQLAGGAALRHEPVPWFTRTSEPHGAAQSWVPDVAARLRDSDESAQMLALEILNRAGPQAAAAQNSVQALERSAPAGSKLQRLAALAALNVARAPGSSALETPLDTRSMENLISILHEPRASSLERCDAAQALRLHATSDEAARELIVALNGEDIPLRRAAARSLGAFGAKASQGLTGLQAMLRTDPKSRAAAIDALARLNSAAQLPGLVPALTQNAVNEEWPDEPGFTKALAIVLKPHAAQAVPALAGFLQTGAPALRARAARTLSLLGSAAHDALPALIEVSKSANAEEAAAAFDAVCAIGAGRDADAVMYLTGVIREGLFADWRRRAVQALGRSQRGLDPGSPDPVDALIAALADPDNAVCRAAAEALIQRGEQAAQRVVEALDPLSNPWALAVPAAYKAAPERTVPPAIQMSRPGQNAAVRKAAVGILGCYAGIQPRARDTLVVLAVDDDAAIRDAACKALRPHAVAAYSQLEALNGNPDPIVRLRATDAANLLSR